VTVESISITASALGAIVAHARDEWPEECCGLLIGTPHRVERVHRARNVAPDRLRRFTIDPRDHFFALRAARVHYWSVVGAYHSHPEGLPVPSLTDVSEAVPDARFLQLIVGPSSQEREPGIAAYRLLSGNFVEIPLVTVA
jgi:proteasome lid subunit RPN8/RPN11